MGWWGEIGEEVGRDRKDITYAEIRLITCWYDYVEVATVGILRGNSISKTL